MVKEIENETCYNDAFHKYHQYIYIVISDVENNRHKQRIIA